MSAHSCNAACYHNRELHELQADEDLFSLEALDEYLTERASKYLEWQGVVRCLIMNKDGEVY